MTNPMTAANQLIYGGTGGAPLALAAPSTANTFLEWNGSTFVYASLTPTLATVLAAGATASAGMTLNNFQVGYSTAATGTGTGIGLVSGSILINGPANNSIGAPIFKFGPYTSLSLTTSTSNVNFATNLWSETFLGPSEALSDTLGSIEYDETVSDTMTNKLPTVYPGFKLKKTITNYGIGHYGGYENDNGNNLFNTATGQTGIGLSNIVPGTAKLDVEDTARGVMVPRLTQTQINNIGTIQSYTVSSAGTGYGYAKVIYTGGSGSGARAHVTLSGSTIASVVVDDGGIDYGGSAPTISLANTTGSGAVITANVGIDNGVEVFNTTTGYRQYWSALASAWIVESGTATGGIYLPTWSSSVNITTITSDSAVWSRSGNTVSVDGSVTITPTSTGSVMSLYGSVPVNSLLSNGHALFGTIGGGAGGGQQGIIKSDGTANKAWVSFGAPSFTSALTFYYHYSYQVQ